MRKYIKFYCEKECEKIIIDIRNNVFDNLSEVSFYKNEVFEPIDDSHFSLLVEDKRRKDIVYNISSIHDGTIIESIDIFKSPVLEYVPSHRNSEGEITEGRFYSCSDDIEFIKKIDKFFYRIKKEFIYNRQYRAYISPNIELSTLKLQKTYL